MEHLVRRDPRQCGLTQTRWTLDAIRSPLVWGRDAALRGIARILDRLGITWQRARSHGPRPDPHDQANLQESADVVEDARAHPNQVVTGYLDDVTVTRQPTLANGDGRAGADPVRAERSRATEGDLLHLQETFSDVVKTDKTGLSKTAHTRWMISAFANFLPGSTIFRLA